MINLVFEDQNLYERFSGRANLRVFADLYGAPAIASRRYWAGGAAKPPTEAGQNLLQRNEAALLIARALINNPWCSFSMSRRGDLIRVPPTTCGG